MSTPLSVQLYSLRDSLAQDFAGTLRRVAEIGFAGVETAGFPGTTPAAARALCAALGLKISSFHGPAPVGATRQESLDLAGALGVKRIVLPYLDPKLFATLDGVREVADLLNAAAAEAKANGLHFAYHNHWFEFGLIDGKPAFDHLLPLLTTDVEFELDLYWIKVGGQDPTALIARLGDRAPLLHVKDGPANGYEAAMVAVGDGAIGYPDVIATHHAEWLVVELDRCDTDMFTAVARSYSFLTEKGVAHGRVK
ncbi:MAG: sugar phosphate isomerase/epimerase [Anaerolineales bacterium]|nr:sugar phosphate isomerase/epimerase [Anaerolineales bacterium]